MFTRRKYSKLSLSAGLLLIILLLCASPVLAASGMPAGLQADKPAFSDLADTSPLYPYVRYLAVKGIIKGFPDGTFRPSESVTRAQAAKAMALAQGLQPVYSVTPTFSDVPADHWAFGVIEAAAGAGLSKGYPDGTFNPDGTITRAEAITLLLRLSEGALSNKTIAISDVDSGHWAYRQIATAVEAGLVELSTDKHFQPDQAFRRGDLARGLSAMFTLSPALRQADLTGKLTVQKGQVKLDSGDGIFRVINGEIRVSAGSKITTGDQAQAEITFDDGSGIRIEASTQIDIVKAIGFAYMRSDGSPGIAVDKLEINLKKGKIFGALASRYEKTEQQLSEENITYHGLEDGKYITLASTKLPPDLTGILFAEEYAGESDNEETAWWMEPYTERERVEVDMPWGVAGIRGTFWMNEVSARGQSTSLIIGNATVTSGGQTVPVTAGQSTIITSASAPPAPPAALTQTEKQAWSTVKDWVTERAQEAQNNIPAPPPPAITPPEAPVEQPPAPVEQQQPQQQEQQEQQEQQQQDVTDIVSIVTQSFEQATSDVTETNTSNSSGGSSPSNTEQAELPSGSLTQDLVKTFLEGAVNIVIPAGTAISQNAGITVTRLSTPPAQPVGAQVAGQVVDISVTGIDPGASIPISLKAEPGKQNVVIAYYNPDSGKWEYQNSVLDEINWFVTAIVQHFSTYAVLEDTTLPTVSATDPVGDATDVQVDKTITVSFDESVQAGSSFSSIALKDESGATVAASVYLDQANPANLIIDPAADLSCGMTYAVNIPAGAVKDLAGNALTAPYTFSFTILQQAPAAQEITGIATGAYHSLALRNDDTVWAWGYNYHGQLGDGTITDSDIPVQVQSLSGVTAIDGGGSHSLVLKGDGTVWAWGYNYHGQLGCDTFTDRHIPVQVQGLAGVTAIAAGEGHSIALKGDGTVWTWGWDYYGQLGQDTKSNRYTPVQVQGLAGVTAITAGEGHSIALKSDGTVWAWGNNFYGQLGDGTTIERHSPVQVQGLSGVTAVASGYNHSIALKEDGTVWTWGNNSFGGLGDGTITDRHTPVQVQGLSNVTAVTTGNYHCIALKDDGTVWAWGNNIYGQLGDGTITERHSPVQVQGLSNVTAVTTGNCHCIALKDDGTVWAWGNNIYGQLGDGTITDRYTPASVQGLNSVPAAPEITGIVAADTGQNTGIGNGDTVTIAFDFDTNQPDVSTKANVDKLIDFGSKSFGTDYHGSWGDARTVVLALYDASGADLVVGDTLAIKDSGNLRTADGQSDPSTTSGFISGSFGVPTSLPGISAGAHHSLALKNNDTVWAWGRNCNGQLGDGTITDSNIPVQIQNLSGVKAIDGGGFNSLVLKYDGTVWAWGAGPLGDGSITERHSPVQVQDLTGVKAVASGEYHSLALKSDGTVWAWGYNNYGQLGDGTTMSGFTPLQVQGLVGVTAIAAGEGHSIALKSDGTVWAWGNNFYGQLGDGTQTDRHSPVQVQGLSGVTAVTSGYYHSIALKEDGTVWAWGQNYFGQLGDGTQTDRHSPVQVQGLSGVTAVTSGYYHSIALKEDGTVWAWGQNYFGQLGDDTTTERHSPVQVQGLSGVREITGGFFHSLALKDDDTVWAWGYNEYGQLGDGTTTDRYTPVQVQGLDSGTTGGPAPLLATPDNYSPPVPGATYGSTRIVTLILPPRAAKWQVKVGSGAFSPPDLDSVVTGASDYIAGDDINAGAGQHLLLLATDISGQVKAYTDIIITAGQLGLIYNQDGYGFSGTIAPNPLSGFNMTGYDAWPDGFTYRDYAFNGGLFDGQNIWLIPCNADRVVKLDQDTGVMTGYDTWPASFVKGDAAFVGGVFDGQNIWMIPYNADRVVKIDKDTGAMTGYNAWPAGFTKGDCAFQGGVFDGQNIWMIPYVADRVVKIDKDTGVMTGYNAWPTGFEAFVGGVFDGQNIWMIPHNADQAVKIDKDTGVMTGYNAWPTGFAKGDRAFVGGVFDGQNIWMIPDNADRVVKIDKDTGAMVGYNAWPAGFVKGDAAFVGGVLDGQNIWMIPHSADRIVGIDKDTGVMTGYNAWPAGFIKGDWAFAGGVFDGQDVWMVSFGADRVIKGGGSSPYNTEQAELPAGTLSQDLVKTFCEGAVSIVIPGGTVISQNATITVTRLSAPPAQPVGAQVAGQVVDISVTGIDPGISIPISLKSEPGKQNVVIAYYNPDSGKWEYQNSVLDETTWFVTATVQHFSTYAVLEDITPPEVIGADPAGGAADVPVNKPITVTFSESVQAGSSFSSIALKDESGATVAANVYLDPANPANLIIDPAADLSCGMSYAVNIPAGAVKDLAGNALAVPYTFSFTILQQEPTAPEITGIAAGGFHSLAFRNDDTVWAWGWNCNGQIGDGTTTDRYIPVQVQGLSDVTMVAAEDSHSLALKRDGTVWTWGYNCFGQLGDGTITNRYIPVQVQSLSGVTAVAAGLFRSFALKSDGMVWAWGQNMYGQLGDGTTTDRFAPVQVKGLSGVKAIGGGYYHSLALKGDGTVWTWGHNDQGQLGDGTTTDRFAPVQVQGLSGMTAVSAGFCHSIALKEDGTVWAWGYNYYGQLGDGTTTGRHTPVQVQGLSNVTAVTAGNCHCIALKEDGTVWTWGYNCFGQLGDGTITNRYIPVQVQSLSGVTAIAVGNFNSLALKDDGTVWAWGYNEYGQLGDGTTTDRYTPVQVQGLDSGTTGGPVPLLATPDNYSSPVPGSTAGCTKIVTLNLPAGATKWQVKVGSGAFNPPDLDSVVTGAIDYIAGDDINADAGQHLLLLATDNSCQVKAYSDIIITAGQLGLIYNQDGYGFSGTIAPNPLTSFNMTGYNAWPAGFIKGDYAFVGGVFDGQNVWLIPSVADWVITGQ